MWCDLFSARERNQTQKDTCATVVLRRESSMEREGAFKVFFCFPHFIVVAMGTSVWNKLASPNPLQISFIPFVAIDGWSLGASLQAVSCE